MNEYCVKRASQPEWEAILEAVNAKDAALKFIELDVDARVASDDQIWVLENLALGTPEKAVFVASDIASRSDWAPTTSVVTARNVQASPLPTPRSSVLAMIFVVLGVLDLIVGAVGVSLTNTFLAIAGFSGGLVLFALAKVIACLHEGVQRVAHIQSMLASRKE